MGKQTRAVTHKDIYESNFCSARAALDFLDTNANVDLLFLAKHAAILVGPQRAADARRIFGLEGTEDDYLTQDDVDSTAAFEDWLPETINPADCDFDNADGTGKSYRKP